METKTKPQYSKGDRVYNLMTKDFATVATPPRWNGVTYMYSFEGEEVRCGEEYLRHLKPKQQSSEAVRLLRNVTDNCVHIGGGDFRINEKYLKPAIDFLTRLTD